MKDDLISRQVFDKFLKDAEEEAIKKRKYVFASALNTISGNLRDFPSAQPDLESAYQEGYTAAESKYRAMMDEQPEIIRCKDCEWFRKEYGWNRIEYTVCGLSPTYHPIRREDDFCSKVERRTDE